jgi:hypothetical protein
MKRERQDKQLDEWIDLAVAEYGSTETRPGFEARIIANVSSRLTARKQQFRRLTMAATATAVLVFSFWVILNRSENLAPGVATSPKPEVQRSVSEPSSHRQAVAQTKTTKPIVIRNRRGQSFPKQRIDTASFGRGLLSGPISEQEHLLIKYVQSLSADSMVHTPDENPFQPIEMPETEISPVKIQQLTISSIQIEPFEIKINESEAKL